MDTLLACAILSAVLTFGQGLPVSDDQNLTTTIIPINNSSRCKLFNPCLNRGRCSVSQLGRYNCECQVGYRGSHCQFIDYCSPNPCVNGVCLLKSDGFSCECNSGYVGDNCSIADACVGITCQNEGTCMNRNGNARCQCSGPYVGRRCEDLCIPNTKCYGNGIGCVVRPNRAPHCECSSHIPNGQIICTLQEDLQNECSILQNPCNGGSCYDTSFGFYCSCPSGRTGTRCENKNPCYPSPCNRGTCSAEGDTYRCTCNSQYGGKNCEYRKNPCTVRCTASSFAITCESSYLPSEVRSKTLSSRQPEPWSRCTCNRFDSYRRRYYNLNNRQYSAHCIIPFDSCGTKMQVINNTAIYDNFLRFQRNVTNRSEAEEPDLLITRQRGDFKLNLECRVPLALKGVGSSITSTDLNSKQEYDFNITSRLDGSSLTLKYYKVSSDESRTLSEITTFGMSDRIYVLVASNQNYGENSNLAADSLTLSNCYATPQSQSRSTRYYLLENGCPRDETFRYERVLLKEKVNDGSLSAKLQTLFSFEPFTFKSANDNIYVHCDGDLCLDGNCNICQDDLRISRRKRHNDE